ncbi:MAG: osmoprotectant transport system substrate-binding protein [Clostridiales bacterium]|jgi:glycine betaine/choline ABC-type transport system substrate-binding protein|nr:osmoprotectant transport system substrate-binding protein [Clostridiales bacterium]MDN5298126.1 osmoprotectant transport system substrate-binding protein [Clostridiales bacterium]
MKKKLRKSMVLLLVMSLMVLALGGCSQKKSATLNIASQNINEVVILANMAKLLVEDQTDYETTINTEFNGSSVLHQAMTQGEIDLYPTWTGTQLTGILRYEGENMPQRDTFEYVKKGFEDQFNMTWSEPFGFNNTYVFVVTEETAETYGLENSSQLAPYAPDWILAGDENFDTRPDAYPGWSEAYGIEFKEVLPMQYGLVYRAVNAGEVDVAVAYATDSRIQEMNLKILEDDKGFFPDYSGAYVLSENVVNSYPEVIDIVNQLGGLIDNEQMVELNYRYDNGDDPAVIAKDFLQEHNLIK